MNRNRHQAWLALGLILPWLVGCGPAGDPQPIQLDANAAARAALAHHDSDKDGVLSTAEWQSSPALAKAAPRIDANKDGRLTPQEIEVRLRAYQSQPAYLGLMMHAQRQGRPVPDVKIRIVPEPCLGEGFAAYAGTTDSDGRVSVARSDGSLRDILPPGLYTVEIETAGTTLQQGLEVATDVPDGRTIRLQIP